MVRVVVLKWVRAMWSKVEGLWVVVVVVVVMGSQFGDYIIWGRKEKGPVRHNIMFCRTN